MLKLLRVQIALAVIFVGLVHILQPHGATPPNGTIFGKPSAVVTYDVDDKPKFLDNQAFLDVCDAEIGKGRYRIVSSVATFNDDQPEFKALMDDPGRKSPDWLTVGTAKKITGSAALPADEKSAEALIRKYAR
jgi:hypothetical protein